MLVAEVTEREIELVAEVVKGPRPKAASLTTEEFLSYILTSTT